VTVASCLTHSLTRAKKWGTHLCRFYRLVQSKCFVVPDQVRYSETLQVPTSHTDLRADLWGSHGGYVSLKPNAEY
jgi:hypothetical protein